MLTIKSIDYWMAVLHSWTLGITVAAYFEPLTHCWNVARQNLWYIFYFEDRSSELVKLATFCYFARSILISHIIFLSPFPCYKGFYVDSAFPHRARLQNSLTSHYDLNDINSSFNRTLNVWDLSKQLFYMFFSLIFSCSCNLMPCSGCTPLRSLCSNKKST